MNTTDKIVTALTPGSIFNRNGLVFRSVASLASFAGMEEDEILELLGGDLAQMVTCKPSKKGKGILVALTDQIPADDADQVQILAGNAIQAEAEVTDAPVVEEEVADGPLPEAPAVTETAETVVGEDLPPQ